MNKNNPRPIFLNLFTIRMPVTAVVSILHRVTGVLLSLCIPFGVYLFGMSLRDEQSFNIVMALLHQLPVKLLIVLLTWMLAHHLFTGIRFLLIDCDIGVSKASARVSAWTVHIGAAAVTALTTGLMV